MKFLKIKKIFFAFMSILCLTNVFNIHNELPECYVDSSFEEVNEDLEDYIEPLCDLKDSF